MTQLATTHLSEGSLKTLDTNNVVLRFRDHSQCINDLFWTMHYYLSNNRSCIMVIDNDESFQHVNYLLSKNSLKEISLLIGSNQTQINTYSHENLTESLPVSNVSFATSAHHKLEISLTELAKRLDLLKTPKLGKLSISQLHDRLKARHREGQQSKQSLNAFELINYDSFRTVKSQIIEAEKQYNYKFKYVGKTSPFKSDVLVNKSSGDLQMILNDFLDDARKLLSEFNEIKKCVQNNFFQSQNKTTALLNEEFSNLKSIIRFEGPAYTLTEEKKIEFYISGLCAQLDLDVENDPHYNSLSINEKYNACKQKYDEILSSIHLETKKKIAHSLRTLTSQHPSFTMLSTLMDESEKLQKEFESLQLMKSFKAKVTPGFYYALEVLELFVEDLDFAQNFIDIESDYIQWMNYMHGLDPKTQIIVNGLAQQDGAWLDTFEVWYLNGFMDSFLPKIKSAEEMVGQVDLDLDEYERVMSDMLLSKAHGQIENIINNQSWLDLFVEQSNSIVNRFPLLLCRPEFFERHKDVLSSSYSDVFFLDNVPIMAEDNFKTRYFTTSEAIQRAAVSTSYANVIKVDDVFFTVNRSIENLSIHELSRCTLHLGQQLKKYGHAFRIFLVNNKTLISFFSPSQNSILLESFREYGIKEIYSNDAGVNLLPGIISDKEAEKIILLEDGLINPNDTSTLLEQVQLLDKVKNSGLSYFSLDTYKLITDDDYCFENLIDKILKYKSSNIALSQIT